MTIPIPPNLGSNRGLEPFNGAATPLSLYDCLIQDPAFVPMQFSFNVNGVWKVDLSANAPRRPLQKISSLYIDALNSTHDAVVFFPGTGWGIRVGAGTQFFVNDLVGKGDYVFYVSLKNGVTNTSDIINIFACNFNTPFFDTLWQYPNGLNGNSSTWFFTPQISTEYVWLYALTPQNGQSLLNVATLTSFNLGFNYNRTDPLTVGIYDTDFVNTPIKVFEVTVSTTGVSEFFSYNETVNYTAINTLIVQNSNSSIGTNLLLDYIAPI